MSEADNQQQWHGGLDGQPPFRVLPAMTEEEQAFWQAGESGVLQVQRCSSCQTWSHPPSGLCPHCLSRDVALQPVSGRGTVYSYTVNVQPWNPTFEHPYVIAVIELDEQGDLRLVSNIYDCPPDKVSIGMRVEVFFEQFEDVWLPLFRPLQGEGEA